MPSPVSPRRMVPAVLLAASLVLSACAGAADGPDASPPSAGTPSPSAAASPGEGAQVIEPTFFGMHEGRVAQGVYPDPAVGSLRFWDSGTSWLHTETSPGQFTWDALDTAVSTAEAWGARPLLVLGQTPSFHASDPREKAAYGPGAGSMPDIEAWRDYVTAVAERYGDRIEYQIWNETNIASYWTGTPAEMAELTVVASEAIREVAPDATVVAPSFALRLEGQREYFAQYWSQQSDDVDLAAAVDVVAVHLYPDAEGVPEDQLELLDGARAVLEQESVDRPIWNAEVNYGLLGGAEPQPIPMERQRAFVMRTYLLNAGAGVERVYWYRWDIGPISNTMLTGDDRQPTLAGRSLATVRGWLEGTTVQGCGPAAADDEVWECTATVDDETRTFWWKPEGPATEMSPPAATDGATSWTDADGRTTECESSCEVPVGETPVMVTSS